MNHKKSGKRNRIAIHTPIAVEPSLIASREYSTWKRRPSGEKVLAVTRQTKPLNASKKENISLYPAICKELSAAATAWVEQERDEVKLTIFGAGDKHFGISGAT